MAINFPTSLDDSTSLPIVADVTDDVLAVHQNDPRLAIIALETKMGIGADTPTVGKFLVGNTSAGTSQWRVLATTDIPDISATYVPKSLYDANSILIATSDNTPIALTVGASAFVGRKATGDIVALTATEARTILNVADGATANPANGWDALGACTYEGADAPNYTISFASDMTAVLSPGMRIKVTDSTVKFFIVMAVGAYSGGKTIITVYGGTDYTLSGGAITAPYYSIHKAPQGFPLDPTKWTVEVSDTAERKQDTPTQNTWYNVGTIAITIPIGVWNVEYHACAEVTGNSGVNGVAVQTALSTANNSASDADFVALAYTVANSTSVSCEAFISMYRRKILTLAAKTAYYLNVRTFAANMTNIRFGGNFSKTIVRAICAYL